VEAKSDSHRAATLNQALVGRQLSFIALFYFFYYCIIIAVLFLISLGAWEVRLLEESKSRGDGQN